MPALSPTMEHGNLTKWIKKEGDTVSAGEVLAEIETDKATMEVEAVDEGVLAKIIVAEGVEEVAVNSLIAVLLEEDEKDADIDGFIKEAMAESGSSLAGPKEAEDSSSESKSKNEVSKSEEKASEVAAAPAEPEQEKPATAMQRSAASNNNRIFASPLAKRIASLENIDLSRISGSGPRGRIIKSDLENIDQSAFANSGVISRSSEEFKLVPNNNMRKVIAKRLCESKATVPHFYLSIECEMDALLAGREQINKQFAGDDKSKKISVNDFVILATAKALKEVPEANASWGDDAIKMYNNVDVSVAVAIDGGLITPVIFNADQKNIMQISSEMKDLAARARSNSLKPEEFQGGGFSISNLGMYGIKNFNAIVNPPQGCILAVGASSKRAVVIDDKIEIRTIMDVNISCDHRVVDGAVGALFLNAFKKYIEAPMLLFV